MVLSPRQQPCPLFCKQQSQWRHSNHSCSDHIFWLTDLASGFASPTVCWTYLGEIACPQSSSNSTYFPKLHFSCFRVPQPHRPPTWSFYSILEIMTHLWFKPCNGFVWCTRSVSWVPVLPRLPHFLLFHPTLLYSRQTHLLLVFRFTELTLNSRGSCLVGFQFLNPSSLD